MILYDEDQVPIGVGGIDDETARRIHDHAYAQGFLHGREHGRQEAHGDWMVMGVVICLLLSILIVRS